MWSKAAIILVAFLSVAMIVIGVAEMRGCGFVQATSQHEVTVPEMAEEIGGDKGWG